MSKIIKFEEALNIHESYQIRPYNKDGYKVALWVKPDKKSSVERYRKIKKKDGKGDG